MERRIDSNKRSRTRFNSWQLQRLERVFQRAHYPDARQMENLSIDINIPTPKMQIWFQNRRAKWRKNSRLKNFGGLAKVKAIDCVPAPQMSDTHNSYALQNVWHDCRQELKFNENSAIDLSKASNSESELSPQSMPTASETYDKSSVYKKSGGITSIRFNDHMNAFEYPSAYYTRHYIDNKKETIPSLQSFAFPSNQSMTSLLFAPTLLYNKPIHSGDEYVSDIQNTYINK